MPKDTTKPDTSIGRIIYQWKIKEYNKHDKNNAWYIFMAVVGLLMVVYAFLAANYLFAMAIVLFGIIIYLHDIQEPLEIPFAITETGVVLGKKFYAYSELKTFWLIYNPPEVKNLYFSTNHLLKHRLSVPLLNYDPRPIRDYLNQYLEEDLDEEEEPLTDKLGRLFKLN